MIECKTFKNVCKSKSLTLGTVSSEFHFTAHTLSYKLKGKVILTGKDMLDLRRIVAPEMSIEELFPEICEIARNGPLTNF